MIMLTAYVGTVQKIKRFYSYRMHSHEPQWVISAKAADGVISEKKMTENNRVDAFGREA